MEPGGVMEKQDWEAAIDRSKAYMAAIARVRAANTYDGASMVIETLQHLHALMGRDLAYILLKVDRMRQEP